MNSDIQKKSRRVDGNAQKNRKLRFKQFDEQGQNLIPSCSFQLKHMIYPILINTTFIHEAIITLMECLTGHMETSSQFIHMCYKPITK